MIDLISNIFKDVIVSALTSIGFSGVITYYLKKRIDKSNILEIADSVKQEKVIGADETGDNVNGVNHCYWTIERV